MGAGYGIRTRGLNFGKVSCCHYTKPAGTQWIIADGWGKVKYLTHHIARSEYHGSFTNIHDSFCRGNSDFASSCCDAAAMTWFYSLNPKLRNRSRFRLMLFFWSHNQPGEFRGIEDAIGDTTHHPAFQPSSPMGGDGDHIAACETVAAFYLTTMCCYVDDGARRVRSKHC